MLKNLLYRLLARRHYWRFVGFDELSELYVSMLLRSLGLSLIGIFVPIYLYQLGYSLPTIFLFLAGLYASRLIANPLAGYLVAAVGPKHVITFSNLAQIGVLLMLMSLPVMQWPLWVIGSLWGVAISLFFIAYHVDFSKVMHVEHGGKELGFMTILERFGGAIGPVVGGVIAGLFGPVYTLGLAVALLIFAVAPLLMTAEPIRTHQKLYFRSLPLKKIWRDLLSFYMMGLENQVALAVWPLYLAVTILTINTYASIGLVTSLGVVASILSAHFIGQMVDRNKGGLLLKWSLSVGALLHAIRPFIGSMGGVLLMNIAHDGIATGFRLPYLKGMYARADELAGMRIVYIVVMECIGDVGKISAWLGLWAVTMVAGPAVSMQAAFIVGGALASLLVMVQNYPALRRRLLSPAALYS